MLLNDDLGTKGKRFDVYGLIDIFGRYKFTVEENTPVEEEVALDPELLGKVFENLLASYTAQVRGDTQIYSALLDWGLRLVLLLALPCAVALLVFAQPMVAVLYHRGAFRPEDVLHTTQALMGYGVGLLGLVAVKVLAPAFYARQDFRTPVRISVVVLILTQLMNALFVPFLGIAGLALSIGLAALVNAGLLFFSLRRLGSYRPQPGWWGFTLRVTIASTLMGALMWAAARHWDWIALGTHEGRRALYLGGVLLASAALYFVALALAGINFREFAKRHV